MILGGEPALLVLRFTLGNWSQNVHLLVTFGKRFCTFIVQVSQDTALFELVEFYSDRRLS